MWRLAEVGLGIAQHPPPARVRRRYTHAQKGEAGFSQDCQRQLDRRLHHQEAGDVRHHVVQGNQQGSLAGRARGQDEVALPDLQGGAARNAGEDRDVEDPDGDHRCRDAGADEAVVRMEYVNQLLRVTIRDNGAGFDPMSARRPTSLGLLSMRERAAAIGADFEILSRPGGGTVIIVERRDTGTIMSDELLETILRGRTDGDLEFPDESDDAETDKQEDTGADASR